MPEMDIISHRTRSTFHFFLPLKHISSTSLAVTSNPQAQSVASWLLNRNGGNGMSGVTSGYVCFYTLTAHELTFRPGGKYFRGFLNLPPPTLPAPNDRHCYSCIINNSLTVILSLTLAKSRLYSV